MSLPELQRAFAGALLARGAGVGWGLAAYRNNSFGNWAGALAGAYPVMRKIVGDDFFDALAREYAHAHPSASGDLNEYGGRLAQFVAGFEPTRDLPYLPDVARMEWLAHLACYAADCTPADPAVIAALPPERFVTLRFAVAPGTALLCSDWPLARIWEVHQQHYRGEFAVEFSPGPHRILVFRPRWKAAVHALAAGEYAMLDCFAHGEILGNALERALAADPSFDPGIAVARWVQAGALTL